MHYESLANNKLSFEALKIESWKSRFETRQSRAGAILHRDGIEDKFEH